VNGESILLSNYYQESNRVPIEELIKDSVVTQDSKGSVSVTTNTKEDIEYNTINNINDEWFSGSSTGGYNGDGTVTSIFSFSKKMDWSLVKSITINDTKISME
jgi:hypothetical protein